MGEAALELIREFSLLGQRCKSLPQKVAARRGSLCRARALTARCVVSAELSRHGLCGLFELMVVMKAEETA
jgi:hypothetical protein